MVRTYHRAVSASRAPGGSGNVSGAGLARGGRTVAGTDPAGRMVVGIRAIDRPPPFAQRPLVQQRLQRGVGGGAEAIARLEEARHPWRRVHGNLEHPGRRLAARARVSRLGRDDAQRDLSGRQIQRAVEPLRRRRCACSPTANGDEPGRGRLGDRHLVERRFALRRPHHFVDHARRRTAPARQTATPARRRRPGRRGSRRTGRPAPSASPARRPTRDPPAHRPARCRTTAAGRCSR